MKDKLEKLKKLADTMYYAAQQLTTDASRLHKAMDEYHQFIIHEYYKEEPEYLEEETTYCAFSTSRYTDEDRKALCKGCEEECEFKPVTSVWHDTKEEPPMDSNVVFRYIDAVSSCRYCGQTMKDVIAWAYFKELKEL